MEEQQEDYSQQPQNNSGEEYISELINVDKELQRFTMEVLRGKVEIINDKGEKEWVNRFEGKKIMNKKGVRGFLSLLRGVVTKLSKLSNKTEEEIKTDMFYFDMRLTSAMYENGDDWGLDLADYELLKESCVRLAWDVAASSRDGFTAINLRSQYTRNESSRNEINNNQPQRKLFGINLTR
jgi:hypothetical protein